MGSWASRLAELTILSSDDGHDVFYPYGFLRGYVIPDATFRPRITSLMVRLQILDLLMLLAELAVVVRFGKGVLVAALLCGMFLHYLFHWAVFRHLTKQFVSLPFLIGFRLYSQWGSEQRLWSQLRSGLLLSLLAILMLFTGVDALKILLVVFFALNSIKTGLLLYARHLEARGVA